VFWLMRRIIVIQTNRKNASLLLLACIMSEFRLIWHHQIFKKRKANMKKQHLKWIAKMFRSSKVG
jgi:hypothetical protein